MRPVERAVGEGRVVRRDSRHLVLGLEPIDRPRVGDGGDAERLKVEAVVVRVGLLDDLRRVGQPSRHHPAELVDMQRGGLRGGFVRLEAGDRDLLQRDRVTVVGEPDQGDGRLGLPVAEVSVVTLMNNSPPPRTTRMEYGLPCRPSSR